MRFTKDHEWVLQDGDTVRIGITEHAATQLGDIVHIDLAEADTEVEAGDEIAVIESVKAASEVAAPFAGRVVEVNQKLAETPSLVNDDALGEGWFFRFKMADPKLLDLLLDEKSYRDFIE